MEARVQFKIRRNGEVVDRFTDEDLNERKLENCFVYNSKVIKLTPELLELEIDLVEPG